MSGAAKTKFNSGSEVDTADMASWPADPPNKAPTHSASHGSDKGKKRRHTFIFLLGSLFGLVAAGFFAKSNDLIDFPEIGELTMDSFFDVLPAGLVTDMRDLVVSKGPAAPTPFPFLSPNSTFWR